MIRLSEPVGLGQSIRKFAVDVRQNSAWQEWLGDGSSVGPQVLLRGKPVLAGGVRVRNPGGRGGPVPGRGLALARAGLSARCNVQALDTRHGDDRPLQKARRVLGLASSGRDKPLGRLSIPAKDFVSIPQKRQPP